MRHGVFGKRLSRSTNEAKRLRHNLVVSLIEHKKIATTLAKAKSVQPLIEQLITKAKSGTERKRREIYAELGDKKAVSELTTLIASLPKRSGGYTRIVKLAARRGDGATGAVLSFVDLSEVKKEETRKVTPEKQEKTQDKNREKKASVKKTDTKPKKTKTK